MIHSLSTRSDTGGKYGPLKTTFRLQKKSIDKSKYCPCDNKKPLEKLSISNQCLCEEIDYEKELILYFYFTTMKNLFFDNYYQLDINTLVDEDNISFNISLLSLVAANGPIIDVKSQEKQTLKKRSRDDIKRSSQKSRLSSSEFKPKRERFLRKKLPSTSILPINEDSATNESSIMEKVVSTVNLEYEWLVKREEKLAKITFKNGNVYEGDVIDKLPNGKGIFQWADGTVYKGEFLNGFPTGKGEMQLPDFTEYNGTFFKGYFHGNGVYNIKTTNVIYSGNWKYGKKHGIGWLLYDPMNWYEGDFKDNLRGGKGFFQFYDGSCYEGSYINNVREGHGAMRWPNNDVYIGNWSNGTFDGIGEYSWKTPFDNTFTFPALYYYNGYWDNGKRNGIGTMSFGIENGAKMVGLFENDLKHGASLIVCGNGKIMERNPLFLDNKPIHLPIPNDNRKSSVDTEHIIFRRVGRNSVKNPKSFSNRKQSHLPQVNQSSEQQRSELCNPIDIQINSPPEEIDLSFYIEKVLNMYSNAFDTIQFDPDIISDTSISLSTATSYESDLSKYYSKWNLMNLSNTQKNSIVPDAPLLSFGRSSLRPDIGNMNKSSTKFQCAFKNEEKYMKNVILRHLPKIMDIYYHYATLTSPIKVHYKHYLVRMFLWQMYLDIGITKMGISLVEIDKILFENPLSHIETCHYPFEHIYFFQFVQSLMGTAILVQQRNQEEIHYTEGILPHIFQKFLNEIVFINIGKHKGRCLFEFKNVLPIQNVYNLYQKLGEPHTARTFLNHVCTKKGEEPRCYKSIEIQEKCFGTNINIMGLNFLYLPEKEDLGKAPDEPIYNNETDPFYQNLSMFRVLGPKVIVQCLYTVCPSILNNGLICNMDYPITFLEFFEVLINLTLLYIARNEKKKEFFRKIAVDDPTKSDDNGELDSFSRKGSYKMKKKK